MTVYVHQLYRNIILNKQAIEKYKLQLAAWSAFIAGTPLLPLVSNSIFFSSFSLVPVVGGSSVYVLSRWELQSHSFLVT